MPWDPALKAAVLDHLFRQASTPRQDTYYLRLRVDAAEVDDEVWTSYERLALDATTAGTLFDAAAAIGESDDRRTANTAELEFDEAAVVVGTPPEVNGWDLMTAAEAGDVLFSGTMPAKPITDGDPVVIPAGALRIDLVDPA